MTKTVAFEAAESTKVQCSGIQTASWIHTHLRNTQINIGLADCCIACVLSLQLKLVRLESVHNMNDMIPLSINTDVVAHSLLEPLFFDQTP